MVFMLTAVQSLYNYVRFIHLIIVFLYYLHFRTDVQVCDRQVHFIGYLCYNEDTLLVEMVGGLPLTQPTGVVFVINILGSSFFGECCFELLML